MLGHNNPPHRFSWSFSALNNFETCPKRHYHYNIAKDVREPEGQQIVEGHSLHGAFDARIRKGVTLPLGLGHHEPMLISIINSPGQTYSERKLAITSSFTPTSWFGDDAWFRGILDCTKITGKLGVVFDWKTGRPKAETTQLQLQSALVFHSAPAVERVRAALVFVNYKQVEREEYVRGDISEIWGEILPRVRRLERAITEQEFPPKPCGLCRRYCAVVSCPHHGVGG